MGHSSDGKCIFIYFPLLLLFRFFFFFAFLKCKTICYVSILSKLKKSIENACRIVMASFQKKNIFNWFFSSSPFWKPTWCCVTSAINGNIPEVTQVTHSQVTDLKRNFPLEFPLKIQRELARSVQAKRFPNDVIQFS